MTTGISVQKANSASCTFLAMSGIGERVKARRLERKLSLKELAKEANNLAYQTVQDLENGKSRGSKHLVAIARALQVSPEWLETGEGPKELSSIEQGAVKQYTAQVPQGGSATLRGNVTNAGPEDMLKVLGMAEGGPDGWNLWNGEIIQWIRRPDNLMGVPGAYAVYVNGHSMEPRYYHGELAHIHPHIPCGPGDYVLVQKKPAQEGDSAPAVIKRLVRKTASKVILSQHNPEKQFEVPANEIASMHQVVGSSKV